MSESDIHDAARAIADPEARRRYLDRMCGDDAALRERVEAMLLRGNGASSGGQLSDLRSCGPVGVDPDSTHSLASSPASDRRSIGRYRIVRHIGRGTFGEVWLGYDDELDRPVAIKVPNSERFNGPEATESFLREARTAAALSHPNLVPVHDIGRLDDGRVYVVSRFIEGPTLSERLKRGLPPAEETARIVATIARALQHAHNHAGGLVHRDIKPANILLEEAGGVPYLADFGVSIYQARSLADTQIAGTPAYMSPEQTRGEKVDPRSDIFALGIVLYEMLTGTRPFGGASTRELFDRICRARPVPPRDRVPAIPMELERICLRAMARAKADRYQSAALLADDLDSWMGDRSGKNAEDLEVPVVPKGLRSFDGDDSRFFLQLLPGPRGRDGLPESVRFWKVRLEETDPEKTFAIGLLYGPSGCGKSSLLKAGVLPRLDRGVRVIVLEASGDDTEDRLVKSLRRSAPDLPAEAGLPALLARLREGPSGKTVVVLDQFEQWLQSHPDPAMTDLVGALRQCDGGRLQAVVLVRDDFALAANRFMHAVETPILEGRNYATIDSFPVDHARAVLVRFGQGLGRLPRLESSFSADETGFVDQATAGLAGEEQRVVPVQLALFADLVKTRPWTPATLAALGDSVGGSRRFLDRVGVAFLEESFHARSANPAHRAHADGAKRVLEALLPDSGTAIKGHKRSESDMLAVSGLTGRPSEFHALIDILDVELRLITPTDPPGDESSGSSVGQVRAPYYQLTHDYLVPALRDWLAGERRRTARGRAELVLAERAAIWGDRPETQQLPSLPEWLRIHWLTRRSEWRASERTMMARADRHHGMRAGLAAVIVITATFGGIAIRTRATAERLAADADRVVSTLLASAPALIEGNAAAATAPRTAKRVTERLRENFVTGSDDAERLRAAIGLIALDGSGGDDTVWEYLAERLLVATPEEVVVISRTIRPRGQELAGRMLQVAGDPAGGPRRLRAAAALAAVAPEGEWWPEISPAVASDLSNAPAVYLAVWLEAFRDVRLSLVPALVSIFGDVARRDAERAIATEALAQYAADNPRLIAELAMTAEPWQFAALADTVSNSFGDIAPYLEGEIARSLPKDIPASAEEREVLGLRQAKAAATLIRFNRPNRVWPLFVHFPDPRVRSYWIRFLARWGADPLAISDRIASEENVSAKRALVLTLGEMAGTHSSGSDRQAAFPTALVERLQHIYTSDPDAGIHAAAEWSLKRFDRREWLSGRTEQWRSEAGGATVRPFPPNDIAHDAPGEASRTPRWYVNGQGQTLVVVPEPATFVMGSPESESERFDDEAQHLRRLDRSFAIGTTSVTLGEYERLMGHYSTDVVQECGVIFARSKDLPAVATTWFMAAAYCNALSRAEGLAEGDLVYVEDEAGGVQGVADDWISRGGYRLPTEAEWEYSARAGTTTSCYYGESSTLAGDHAWVLANSELDGRPTIQPVAEKLPNDFGLFDCLGNVFNWFFRQFSGRVAAA